MNNPFQLKHVKSSDTNMLGNAMSLASLTEKVIALNSHKVKFYVYGRSLDVQKCLAEVWTVTLEEDLSS
jgi:hypothetical protein